MKAREVAQNCLNKIIINKSYANLVMKNDLKPLSDVDKGLVTEIVYGTLRNQVFLRYQWSHFVKKMLPEKGALIIDAAVYQLFMMDNVPEYAIVNEAVEMSKSDYKGVVNAVLHKVIDQGLRGVSEKDPLEQLAISYSQPKWLVSMWNAHYGEETTKKILGSMLEPATLYGRINTLKISKEELEKNPTIHFIDDICFVSDDNLVQSSYLKDGSIIIQDYSSQQVCKFLDAFDNMKILDCCAAPGTKTSQLAMMLHNTGEIIATDIHDSRIQLIEDSMVKMGVSNVVAKKLDATISEEAYDDQFDAVMIDAPCSGLGVLKRKPDIKFRVQPSDIDEIIGLQKKILNASCKAVKIGGQLIYSTCSLNKKENEKQIEKFIASHPQFELIEQKTIFPFEYQSDGFYMAKLKRIG